MFLFKYLAGHWLDALIGSCLKVSKVSSFNDPFECMFNLVGPANRREARYQTFETKHSEETLQAIMRAWPGTSVLEAKKFADKNAGQVAKEVRKNFLKRRKNLLEKREEFLNDRMRLACFSSSQAGSHDEILMWSHYADCHNGVRLGFQFPRDLDDNYLQIIPIIYSKKRVPVEAPKSPDDLDALKKALLKSVRTKSESWGYEAEYRLFVEPSKCIQKTLRCGTEIEVIPFPVSWLKRVDLGLRLNQSHQKAILEVLKEKYPHVRCYRAEFHSTEYKLEYNRLFF